MCHLSHVYIFGGHIGHKMSVITNLYGFFNNILCIYTKCQPNIVCIEAFIQPTSLRFYIVFFQNKISEKQTNLN